MHQLTRGLPVVDYLFMARRGAGVAIVPRSAHPEAIYSCRPVAIVVPVTILIGGFLLRCVVLIAGQIARPSGRVLG